MTCYRLHADFISLVDSVEGAAVEIAHSCIRDTAIHRRSPDEPTKAHIDLFVQINIVQLLPEREIIS